MMKIEKMIGIRKSSPPQGLFEARRGKNFSSIFLIRSLIRRGGAPSGAAGFIVTECKTGKFPYHISLDC